MTIETRVLRTYFAHLHIVLASIWSAYDSPVIQHDQSAQL